MGSSITSNENKTQPFAIKHFLANLLMKNVYDMYYLRQFELRDTLLLLLFILFCRVQESRSDRKCIVMMESLGPMREHGGIHVTSSSYYLFIFIFLIYRRWVQTVSTSDVPL